MDRDTKNRLSDNMRNLHRNEDGSWGTDEQDGKIIGDILRGIGDMIAKIITAKNGR